MKGTFKFSILAFYLFLNGCKSDSVSPSNPTPVTPAPTVAEIIKKNWSANTVLWDGVSQFDKSSASNLIQGYNQYKLDLSNPSSLSIIECDGKKFTGKYSLSSDNQKLIISDLSGADGAPSGTNGTVEFKVISTPTTNLLVIETSSPYVKASNKVVRLSLIP
ncbi:hypothetical protein G9H61_04410 [Aquirufa ecclesiirivi]|uniref:Lipocalin-like domain-containing protein n=1 Tax=Aquirufa ecclesiirivi TaxID=2715124 RepID=A0ABT4JEM5_9BACT|nr:hypothetical protein [Aquirufa ecclesiirivi]MCZ2474673.1 hypothetical protein [Aquirufa ecclesiirivi]